MILYACHLSFYCLDFEKLQESLKKRSLDDQFLTVDTVEVSRQVKVTGYAKQTLDDTLIFFFENKRSGGGDVVNVIREEDRILVEFRNTEGRHFKTH